MAVTTRKMLLVDLDEKRIISDEELKDNLVNLYPYDEWVKNSKVNIKSIDFNTNKTLPEDSVLLDLQQAFGYNKEDLKFFLEPMILEGQDPIGSMGRDIPLAALSDKKGFYMTIFFKILLR